MHKIVTPIFGWQPFRVNSLLIEEQVQASYENAQNSTHPNFLPQGASVFEKMLAQELFIELGQDMEVYQDSGSVL